MRFPDEPIPDCVPEFYREQEEERDRRYDLAMQRREHYQSSRRKLDAAAEAGLPVLPRAYEKSGRRDRDKPIS